MRDRHTYVYINIQRLQTQQQHTTPPPHRDEKKEAKWDITRLTVWKIASTSTRVYLTFSRYVFSPTHKHIPEYIMWYPRSKLWNKKCHLCVCIYIKRSSYASHYWQQNYTQVSRKSNFSCCLHVASNKAHQSTFDIIYILFLQDEVMTR